MYCDFSGRRGGEEGEEYQCLGVNLTKLQSGFVEIALMRCCSPVGLLHVWGVSSLENTSGGLLLNGYNFIYNF